MRGKLIRTTGAVLAAVFAAVGLVFLLIPSGVVSFFNRISAPWGFPPAPAGEPGLFVLLAVAYMTVVTALAWGMARRPGEAVRPRLLALAKIASAVLSLGFFVLRSGALIFLLNAVVDGSIGGFVLWLTRPARTARPNRGRPA
jgi:hypothetical protein